MTTRCLAVTGSVVLLDAAD